MRTCPRCGRENSPENVFCGRCGLEFAQVQTQIETAEQFCYKHPKEPTNLHCGKCGRPICHKCVVMSPAGTRCRECSKSNVAFRPAAVAHEAKVGVRSLLRMGPWTIWIWIVVIGMLVSLVRGCFVWTSGPPSDLEFEEPPAVESER